MPRKHIKGCYNFLANLSYVGNGAAAFGEKERYTIFQVVLRRL